MLEYGWKRCISGLLALVLVVGMLPPAAVAAEETEATEVVEVQETEPVATEPVETEPVETTVATEAVTEPVETTVATEVVTEPAEETVPETAAETVEETTEATEPALPENVAAVQSLLDALPTLDTVTAEDYDFVQDAYDAYEALTEEEKALIQGAEKFEALFSWFNAQVETLDSLASGTCGENLTWALDGDGTLTISGTGSMDNYVYNDFFAPWYSNRSSITAVVIEEGVTSIGDYAFYDHTFMKTVTIPDGITYLGHSSFMHCENLAEVTLPESLSFIGAEAFGLCYKLKTVCIPQYVTQYGPNVFGGCYGMTAFQIDAENKAYTIVNGCLLSKDGKTLVEVPCGLTGSFTVPIGVTKIDMGAFAYSQLTDVALPEGVTLLDNSCFAACNNLASVTLPRSLTSIHWDVFQNSYKLTSLYYNGTKVDWENVEIWPNNTESLARMTIYVAKGTCGNNLNWVLDIEGTLTISGTGIMEAQSYGNAPWYVYRDYITSVVIEEGVTKIGGAAFYDCGFLTNVTIPNSVTEIGSDAFHGCSSLTGIVIPKRVTSIGGGAFSGCSGLSSITIPDSVTSIVDGAFSGCSGLTSITIPDSVIIIGDSAFESCKGLTSITLPRGIRTIRKRTFYGCTSLTSLTIPGNVISIGDSAFGSCDSLTSLIIPEGVTSIGDSAFWNCNSMTSITIPDSVTSIGDSAFCHCRSLTNVTIPEKVASVSSLTFGYCTGLTSVTIPESVASIGEAAFHECNKLTDIYYKGNLESWCQISIGSGNSILSNAAVHCTGSDAAEHIYRVGMCGENLTWVLDKKGLLTISGTGEMENNTWSSNQKSITSVMIGEGVTNISHSAFSGCSSLKGITIPESVTSIGNYAFNGCEDLTGIVIP